MHVNGSYLGTAEAATPDRPDLEAAALDFAAREWPVFRLRPGTKEPFHGSRGFYDATTDPETIRRLWRQSPNANVGIATGPASGMIVLDVDPDKWGAGTLDALVAEHGELPPTYTVRSGGGGLHHYFRYPAGEDISISAGKLGPGLDVRAKGGYIVAAGSRTEGPYELLEDAPLAEPPEWLIALLRRPQRPASGAPGGRRLTVVDDGGPIFEGARNNTLTAVAGRLHDGSRNPEDLADELHVINDARCSPPLQASEVEKIAKSIATRTPCKATARATPETLEALDAVERLLREPEGWKGNAWKSPYSALVVLVKEARRHGTITEAGVEVRISVRRLALEMATSKETARKALNRLYEAGIAARVAGGGSGRQAGRIALRAKLAHSSTGVRPPRSVPTLRAPYSSPRLRWSRPVFESGARVDTIRRLGKTAERTVDLLETRKGWTEVRDLADDLGIGRPRDFRRRTLGRLEASAVVECSGDFVRLRPDWLAALDRRRVEDLEVEDLERDRKKFAEESRRYATKLEAGKLWRIGMNAAEIAAELDVGIEDVRRLLNLTAPVVLEAVPDPVEADGFISELERVPESEATDDQAEGADVEILAALADYLYIHPHRLREGPSWLANLLWSNDLVDGKPTPDEVSAALAMLPERRAA